MLDNGAVVESGTYDHLKKINGSFANFIKDPIEPTKTNTENDKTNNNKKTLDKSYSPCLSLNDGSIDQSNKKIGKLIVDERIEKGKVYFLMFLFLYKK